MTDMLPCFPQVPRWLGTDKQALDNIIYSPLYPTRMTEVLHHSVKTILRSPALAPTNEEKSEKYHHSRTNNQVQLTGTRTAQTKIQTGHIKTSYSPDQALLQRYNSLPDSKCSSRCHPLSALQNILPRSSYRRHAHSHQNECTENPAYPTNQQEHKPKSPTPAKRKDRTIISFLLHGLTHAVTAQTTTKYEHSPACSTSLAASLRQCHTGMLTYSRNILQRSNPLPQKFAFGSPQPWLSSSSPHFHRLNQYLHYPPHRNSYA